MSDETGEAGWRADRENTLAACLTEIERRFGGGAVLRLGERPRFDSEAISTGSLGLDLAIGVGGAPRGRITQIHGPEGSGKSTLALHLCAEAQKKGGIAAYIDIEHSVRAEYAASLGANIDTLLFAQPGTAEEALGIVDALVRCGAIDLIVLDSVAALAPQTDLDGDRGDRSIESQMRFILQELKNLHGAIARSSAAAIFINPAAEKLSKFQGGAAATPGGHALKFYSSVTLDVRRVDSIQYGSRIVGSRVAVKVARNKVAAPFKTVEFEIEAGRGISRAGEVVDIGAKLEIVGKTGSWYTYDERRLGQGREHVKMFLIDNPTLMAEIQAKIVGAAFGPPGLRFHGSSNGL